MKNFVKSILFLIAVTLLFTSCGPDPDMPAVWYVPLGIEILAWIGFATVILLLVIFILSFGDFRSNSDD